VRQKGHALTLSVKGRLRAIQTPCSVCAAFDPPSTPKDRWGTLFAHKFTALWDTGATGSVITQAVVDACGLKPTGMTQVHHAAGASLQETYLVNIQLPNGLFFAGITVTKAPLTGTPVLIGMDIIAQGDFALTNKNGESIFTFRFPSTARFDFVKEEERLGKPHPSPGASFHGKTNRKR
jgi:hypothetical protein